MKWKKTQLTEPKERAASILENMGAEEGHVHILQLQYFCQNKEFSHLLEYWQIVETQFKKLKNER